jgi:ribosome modulation factor
VSAHPRPAAPSSPTRRTPKLNLEAEEAGRQARARGLGAEACPAYPAHSLVTSWLIGWEEAAPPPAIAKAPPPGPVDLTERWPADRPLPDAIVRPRIPCPSCRLVRQADGRRAALQVSGGSGGVAHFVCCGCGHAFKMPVRSE